MSALATAAAVAGGLTVLIMAVLFGLLAYGFYRKATDK